MPRCLAAVCVLLALSGCGSDGDGLNCNDGQCVCRDETACDFDCEGDGCNAICEQLSTCDGLCGDGCSLTCRDTSACSLACGDRCTVLCERASTCEVQCAGDCDVTCRDLSTCDVTMEAGGTLRCDGVSECNLRCPGDLTPTDCGGGFLACPPVTCPS
jgi:hypothetical protein